MSKRAVFLKAGQALAALAAFYLFYARYVPLVGPFQAALAPVLLACFALTAARPQWGALFFVFCFPLINILPYFFGIFEDTPHAPAALVLFLAFLLGWLTGRVWRSRQTGLDHPIVRPLALFLAVVGVSGVITFLRFANFFPFRSPAIYELVVNVNGVGAGGALMSDVFSLLNYLIGPLFFILVMPLFSEAAFLRRVLVTLSASGFVSLAFALVQKYHSLSLGNYPFFIKLHQLNGTFKDPNSFGAFLSCFIPLSLGAALSFRKGLRWLSLVLVVMSFVVFPAVGSRSSLGALAVSLVVLGLLVLAGQEVPPERKFLRAAAFLAVVCALLGALLVFQSQSILAKRVGTSLGLFSARTSLSAFFNVRLALWKAALSMTENYPLTGVGLGAYIIELPSYLRSLGLPFKSTDSALNFPLQVSAELGLVGLALIAWAAFEVLKQLGRSWRSCPKEKRHLLAGVMAGLAAFGVNFLFQTYIGSFEIKAVLWLLIALALALGREGGRPARSAPPTRRNLGLPVLAFVLVFGAVHFWNSTHSLSLERRTTALGIRQEFGLDRVETTPEGREFRWSRKQAAMTVRLKGPGLEIPLLASHPDVRERPVVVRVSRVVDFFRGKRLLSVITIRDNSWITCHLSLPSETGRDVILLFEVSRTWNPQRTLGAPDPRNLGVAIGKIEY